MMILSSNWYIITYVPFKIRRFVAMVLGTPIEIDLGPFFCTLTNSLRFSWVGFSVLSIKYNKYDNWVDTTMVRYLHEGGI